MPVTRSQLRRVFEIAQTAPLFPEQLEWVAAKSKEINDDWDAQDNAMAEQRAREAAAKAVAEHQAKEAAAKSPEGEVISQEA